MEQRYQQGHPLGRFSLTNLTCQAFNRYLLERFIPKTVQTIVLPKYQVLALTLRRASSAKGKLRLSECFWQGLNLS